MFDPRVETMPRPELEALKLERLKHIVRYCYENVPFYHQRFDAIGLKPEDIRTLADIRLIPPTTKADLRDNYPFGLFAVPTDRVVRIHASSGTTGKPTVVGYTKNDLDMWAGVMARIICAAGVTEKDIAQISFGYGLFTGGPGLNGGSHKVGCLTLPMSSGNTERQIQFMMDLKSTILCCTPSYAAYIGETLHDMGYGPQDIHLRAGIFGAEPWTEEMRRDIEKSLGIKAYDIYGLTEISGPGVSFECEEQHGMHINEDHFIAEIINPQTGEVLPEGEKGELVFTCLDKEAFPMMRYRTRDICVLSHKPCSCGRTFVRMHKPMGRSDDMLIIRGVNVFPSQIETVLIQKGYTSNYLIEVDRVNNSDTLDILVEMLPEQFSDAVRDIERREKELADAMRTMLGIGPKMHLVAPKTIQRSEGKAVRVIDKRKLHD